MATQELLNTVNHSDVMALMEKIGDQSIDAIATDPPYIMGLDEWDTSTFSIDDFIKECERVLKPTGFLAFTHQMPYMLTWLNVLAQSKTLRYIDHIAWVKRKITNPMTPITRGWESLFIYRMPDAKYFDTKGKFEDISMPKYIDGLGTIENLMKWRSDLERKSQGVKVNHTENKTRHTNYKRFERKSSFERYPDEQNITNVWSFIPENMSKYKGTYEHASMKPVKMFERLCTLLTPEGGIIVDTFVGSGTTAIACRNTGRNFIVGDITPEYIEITNKRLAEPHTPKMFNDNTDENKDENDKPETRPMF